MNLLRGFLVLAASLGALGAPMAWAQSPPGDALLEQVESLLQEAQGEIEAFRKGGGRNDDAQHPAGKWAEKLWAFREQHPGTRAAGKAASEAIHVLVHAERFVEVRARADALPPDDPAWEFLPGVLLEAATQQKDYSYAISRLQGLLEEASAEPFHAALHFHLGRAYRGKGDEEAAKAALETALRLAPEAPWARQAQELLYEMVQLAIGQPAPAVSARTRRGDEVSLAEFKDKAVLLIFWAST